MQKKIFSVLATLLGVNPALAVTLTHPDIPIFKACASDMNVDGETIASRILTLGWPETGLSTELQDLGRDHAVLTSFGSSVYLGEATKQNWDAGIEELSDVIGLDQFGSGHADTSETIRAFADPEGSGYAVLTFEPDGVWSCSILLTATPVETPNFILNPPSSGESAKTDGVAYMFDEHRMGEITELLSILPFLPKPKHYYSDYLLADPEIVRARFNHEIKLVFAAEFHAIYPY